MPVGLPVGLPGLPVAFEKGFLVLPGLPAGLSTGLPREVPREGPWFLVLPGWPGLPCCTLCAEPARCSCTDRVTIGPVTAPAAPVAPPVIDGPWDTDDAVAGGAVACSKSPSCMSPQGTIFMVGQGVPVVSGLLPRYLARVHQALGGHWSGRPRVRITHLAYS